MELNKRITLLSVNKNLVPFPFVRLFGKTVDDILNEGDTENREHQYLGTIVEEIAENWPDQLNILAQIYWQDFPLSSIKGH
ncbi:hypothetical protein H1230_17080 [Paenibacillus sp. 19GGS1-52]|uniref:hypothetical protein n=1 Tax=Paenibacillus sp. 19GGS1-52 TaxID=2758563 RepID=UPI001EFB5CA2|nr:hypothetical protein [Paenibacillus sp. 19GGS1-52]ULO04857.1 hypothetical protein H1230_17080 [Paenibacillus sp. 19GGS1-52]